MATADRTTCTSGRQTAPLEFLPFVAALAVPLATLGMMAGTWHVLEGKSEQRRLLAEAGRPPIVKVDPGAYVRGQQLYAMACVACHGSNGRGVTGLGKDLVASTFAHKLTDAQLATFVAAGRPIDDPMNTTKVPMPPKGGRADFSDSNIADVVAYLRGLSDPRRVPDGPLPAIEVVVGDGAAASPAAPLVAAAAVETAPAAIVTASASSTSSGPAAIDADAAARGKKAFVSCMACHGKDARGVKKMGKDLVESTFTKSLNDAQLVDFIKKGRGPTDPVNTTKVAMPPKGGNPAIKDEQLKDIVAYIRSLQRPGDVKTGVAAVAPAPAATPAPAPATPVAVAAPVAAPAAAPAPSASPSPAPVAVASASVSASASSGDAIVRGKRAFISCMACHGKDARGVKNMGKDLVASPFVGSLSDDALVAFIKKGRGPTDPGNTTKVGMPPKGGNPALKDEQILDIVAYIRSLRQQASARTE